MPAYVIVEVEVKNPEGYEEYKKLAAHAVAIHGGKFLARGGRAEKLEGDKDPERVVILEFENTERAKAWWNSKEYTEARKTRNKYAESRAVVVEGIDLF